MLKRNISIAVIVICAIVLSFSFAGFRKRGAVVESCVVVDTIAHTGINLLLNNSMSDFAQTESFDKSIEWFMRRWEIPGGSFALMRNDSLIYAKGYGFADKSDSLTCDVNNVFRIASVSKLITATAVMKLIEDGKLSLNSQVFGEEGILNDSIFLDLKYQNLQKITVDHLLRHTAGFSTPIADPAFANYSVARRIGKTLPLSVDDMVIYATQNRLRTAPGGSFHYSNLGYIILGKIVEKATNLQYETYVQDSILAPIGCYDMFIGRNFEKDRKFNEVNYYEVKEAEPVEAFDGSGMLTMKSNGGNNVTLLSSAGGWVASPTELLRFVAAINGSGTKEDILSMETINTMTNNALNARPIGWATANSYEWQRSGSMAGTTALIKKERNGYTWVFITNSSAWIGPNLTKYISSHVTRALGRVKQWPTRDLFEIKTPDALTATTPSNKNEENS